MEINSNKKQELEVHIRPMYQKDLEQVDSLQNEGSLDPWPRKSLRKLIKDDACEKYVALTPNAMVGFAICFVTESLIDLSDLVVGPFARRAQVGTKLLQRVFTHIAPSTKMIETYVPDSNDAVPAHLFLQRNKFRASRKFKKRFFQVIEQDRIYTVDGIRMVYWIPQKPINRITEYLPPRKRV